MRLIDADSLMKAMYHRAFETDGDTMWQSGCWVRYRAIEQVVKEQPSVEAEPVVRCKDCIHYEARQKNHPWKSARKYCNRQTILCMEPNDFCSFAERRTDGFN